MDVRDAFRTVTLAAVLAVAGCSSYRQAPLDPQRTLDDLRGRDISRVDVTHVSGTWQPAPATRPFNLADGLDEAEVVAVALVLNPQLQAKRLELGQAEAGLITAGLWPNPEVGLTWQAGIDARGSVADGEVLFELLRLGERQARTKVARAGIEQVRAEVLAEEYELVADVRAQYVQVLAAIQAAELAGEELALRQQIVDLLRQRQQIGEGTELDIALGELELAGLQRDARRARAAVAEARRELNRLLGLPPEYDLNLTDAGRPLAVTVYDDLTDEELDRRLLAGRPELRARQAAYEQAEQELRLAVLGQYPRLAIGPAFSRELEGPYSLGAGISLQVPVFDRNQGEIAARRNQRQQAQAQYVALLHQLRADAHQARAEVRRARAEVEAIERQVLPVIERSRELFERAFRARELSVVDWVTTQQRVLQARREYLESLAEYRKALVRLEAAIGAPLAQPADSQK